MHNAIELVSFGIGIILGILYGLSFLFQKKRGSLFSRSSPPYSLMSIIAHALFFFVIRIGFLALVLYYLLRWPSINFILVVLGFLGAFWVIIIKSKASFHET